MKTWKTIPSSTTNSVHWDNWSQTHHLWDYGHPSTQTSIGNGTCRIPSTTNFVCLPCCSFWNLECLWHFIPSTGTKKGRVHGKDHNCTVACCTAHCWIATKFPNLRAIREIKNRMTGTAWRSELSKKIRIILPMMVLENSCANVRWIYQLLYLPEVHCIKS